LGSRDAGFPGNGVGNEKTDGQLARHYTIGYGIILAGDDPLVGSVSPEQELTGGETTATVWAEDVTTTGTVDQVWAVITPPGEGSGGQICPGFDPSGVDLIPAGGGRYEVDYSSFTDFGTYEVAVHALDTEGNVSQPKETTVFQGTGPDKYEEDDTYGQAGIIVLNDPQGQTHGFHDAGDQDWVKFYATAGETYTVTTSNLGSNCDTVIEVYGTDGSTLLASRDDGGIGEDEMLDWPSPAVGVYYVKVLHHNPAAYGEGNEYDLKVYNPIGPFSGFIEGLVRDAATGAPLGNALLSTNEDVTAIAGSDGRYLMVHPPGTYPLMADATGYSTWAAMVSVDEATTVTKNVSMTKSGNGGTCAAVGSADGSTYDQNPVHGPFDLGMHMGCFLLPLGVAMVLRTWRRKK
jgi:hypothetical protein